MMSLIVAKINKKNAKMREHFSQEFLNDSRNSYVVETSKVEIVALLGLFYVRGLLGTITTLKPFGTTKREIPYLVSRSLPTASVSYYQTFVVMMRS